MREHKYQAWHKQAKKMHKVAGILLDLVHLLVDLSFNSEEALSTAIITVKSDEVELREYTGIKDSKGQEIYEGDIIRAEEEGLGVIKYGVGCFYYEDDWNGRIALEELTDLMVVVGNIYEHPHLLPVEHKTTNQQ